MIQFWFSLTQMNRDLPNWMEILVLSNQSSQEWKPNLQIFGARLGFFYALNWYIILLYRSKIIFDIGLNTKFSSEETFLVQFKIIWTGPKQFGLIQTNLDPPKSKGDYLWVFPFPMQNVLRKMISGIYKTFFIRVLFWILRIKENRHSYGKGPLGLKQG